MSSKTIKVCLTISGILAAIFFSQISQSSFSAPLPTPGITLTMRDWCERFYWAILKSWAKNGGGKVKKISCVFNVQSNGDISNVRILKSSGSAEVDQEAVSVLKQASPLPDFTFTGRPLKSFKEPPEIFAHFEEYPVLRLTMEDSGYSVYAWPPDRGPDGNPSTMSDIQLLNYALDHTCYLLQAPWVKSPDSPDLVSVSCICTMGTKGEIGDLRILKSSGSDATDQAALVAIKGENPPFEKLLAPLHDRHEIVFEFYSSGDLRSKLKENQNLVPIGRSGQLPDPPVRLSR